MKNYQLPITNDKSALPASKPRSINRATACLSVCVFATVNFSSSRTLAQDFLKTLPAYERYQKVARELTNAVSTGPRSVTWKNGGKAVEYQFEAKRFRYDIESGKLTELGSATPS